MIINFINKFNQLSINAKYEVCVEDVIVLYYDY